MWGNAYDSEFDCIAEDALDKKTYDGDENTFLTVQLYLERAKIKFYFGHASLYNLVVGAQNKSYFFMYAFNKGYLSSMSERDWYWNGNLEYAC